MFKRLLLILLLLLGLLGNYYGLEEEENNLKYTKLNHCQFLTPFSIKDKHIKINIPNFDKDLYLSLEKEYDYFPDSFGEDSKFYCIVDEEENYKKLRVTLIYADTPLDLLDYEVKRFDNIVPLSNVSFLKMTYSKKEIEKLLDIENKPYRIIDNKTIYYSINLKEPERIKKTKEQCIAYNEDGDLKDISFWYVKQYYINISGLDNFYLDIPCRTILISNSLLKKYRNNLKVEPYSLDPISKFWGLNNTIAFIGGLVLEPYLYGIGPKDEPFLYKRPLIYLLEHEKKRSKVLKVLSSKFLLSDELLIKFLIKIDQLNEVSLYLTGGYFNENYGIVNAYLLDRILDKSKNYYIFSLYPDYRINEVSFEQLDKNIDRVPISPYLTTLFSYPHIRLHFKNMVQENKKLKFITSKGKKKKEVYVHKEEEQSFFSRVLHKILSFFSI